MKSFVCFVLLLCVLTAMQDFRRDLFVSGAPEFYDCSLKVITINTGRRCNLECQKKGFLGGFCSLKGCICTNGKKKKH
ncbi:hypothetical protein B7P43_G03423 [Cryptotermes secundus]|uniref:Invertebrate defensins family profile domain-containing protein n=1 Tax=Cryptotermes secundus TaxID=105785 RepID=A0A2J7RLM0_9NEOP|nr:defense protein 6-like [Cryptotermes secundus]PNF41734.1 hypothetical protein B7P43_G03423 [Cryptotermes secundus]